MEPGVRNREGAARSVLRQVAALQRMSHDELREQWRVLLGGEPPEYRHQILVRRLAHRIQELAFGETTGVVRERLEETRTRLGLDDMALARVQNRRGTDTPVPGTRFIREWNGDRYEVTVTRDGFDFQGRTFRSLSAIAKVITGTHWNGRAFFGLGKSTAAKGGRA